MHNIIKRYTTVRLVLFSSIIYTYIQQKAAEGPIPRPDSSRSWLVGQSASGIPPPLPSIDDPPNVLSGYEILASSITHQRRNSYILQGVVYELLVATSRYIYSSYYAGIIESWLSFAVVVAGSRWPIKQQQQQQQQQQLCTSYQLLAIIVCIPCVCAYDMYVVSIAAMPRTLMCMYYYQLVARVRIPNVSSSRHVGVIIAFYYSQASCRHRRSSLLMHILLQSMHYLLPC